MTGAHNPGMDRPDSDRPDSGTWHYGLIARYWAEVNTPDPAELERCRAAIEEFGQPALDLGCGTGRLLVPLLAAGLDVDGVDVSEDMLGLASGAAAASGFEPRLARQAFHELDLERTYRTIISVGSIGIGGDRAHDLEAMRRVRRHLAPGGAFVLDQHLMNDTDDVTRFAWWLPTHRPDLPRAWRDQPQRKVAPDGDEFELEARAIEHDPLAARELLEIRARLWRDGVIVAEEFGRLAENQYLVPELRLMLEVAGFSDVRIESGYARRPATGADSFVVFVARA
mgnify:CR=1 FL=1